MTDSEKALIKAEIYKELGEALGINTDFFFRDSPLQKIFSSALKKLEDNARRDYLLSDVE